MKTDRKELRDKLAALKPGLAKREFVAQATHFIFFDNLICTFNDKILITIPFECNIQFSVKGEEFFRLIDGITDKEIIIELKNNKIKVRSKTTTSSMATIGEDQNNLPALIKKMLENMDEWQPVPENFLDGVSLCAFSASPDLSSGVRACVAVVGNKCYATDGNRISQYTMSSEINENDFNIFSKEAMELSKFPVIEYCMQGKWLHFRTEDGVTFSTSFIQGDLPINKIKALFSNIQDFPSLELPGDLKATLDNVTMLAADMSDRTGKASFLHIEDNEITVKASNDLGWVEKSLKCKYSGDPIDIGINNRFLSQILQKSTKLSWFKTALYFSSGDFLHVLMQISKPEPEEEKPSLKKTTSPPTTDNTNYDADVPF